MKASIVITTRNRENELRTAVSSALRQTGDVEVIVLDDGSTDGTTEMIRQEFPQVLLDRSATSRGLVAQRNRGAALATGDVIFSIDDDAEFSAPSIVETTIAEFKEPQIGAVALPLIEPDKDGVLRQTPPDVDCIWVTDSFIGTAHAVRRDIFLALGGYRSDFIHQGEEQDFCIRLINEGYVVRLGNSAPILHYESPRRDTRRMDFYGRRNNILFVWFNVPWPYFLVHLVSTTFNALRTSFTPSTASKLHGVAAGYVDCLRYWRSRKPVRSDVYGLCRRLKKGGPLRFEAVMRVVDAASAAANAANRPNRQSVEVAVTSRKVR